MCTRGLSDKTARTLLRQAFMADVIEPVPLTMLRDRLRMLVDKRLDGSQSHDCTSCGAADCRDAIDITSQS